MALIEQDLVRGVPQRFVYQEFLPNFLESQVIEINHVYDLSKSTLNEVVTSEGIFASTRREVGGCYNALFGRDANYMMMHTIEAYREAKRLAKVLNDNSIPELTDVQNILNTALIPFKDFKRYQGEKYDSATGEERGKVAHEVRTHPDDIIRFTQQNGLDGKPWPMKNGAVISWDSVDATAGRVFVWSLLERERIAYADESDMAALRANCEWMLDNMDGILEANGKRNGNKNKGFPGFSYDPNRPFGGLYTQSWKDSKDGYLDAQGNPAPHPIRPVEVSALTYVALKGAADMFILRGDNEYAELLNQRAKKLKNDFNSENGFLKVDPISEEFYFAEALVGDDCHQLQGTTSDVLQALTFSYDDMKGHHDSIIDARYIRPVVERNMMELDIEAGFPIYSEFDPPNSFDRKYRYHRWHKTYWVMQTGTNQIGLDLLGFQRESDLAGRAIIRRMHANGSCLELYVKDVNDQGEPEYNIWRNPDTDQLSCTDQGFSASAGLYTTIRAKRRMVEELYPELARVAYMN